MKHIVLCLLLSLSVTASAQRTVTAEGFASIIQTDDMTAQEARERVVEQARFDAVNTAFGSNISHNNVTFTTEENGKSNTTVFMMGASDLRGRWIRDLVEPIPYKVIADGQIIWEVKVKCKVREVKRATVGFEWQLLANGHDEQFKAKELHHLDSFFVRFRSPVDGYLQVFMADDKGVVNRLLPAEDEEYCRVNKDKWYCFYEDPEGKGNCWMAMIPNNRRVEYDQLYIVFSPNKIHPPLVDKRTDNSDLPAIASKGHLEHIPELSFKAFQKHLGKMMDNDAEVQVEKMLVKITKRE